MCDAGMHKVYALSNHSCDATTLQAAEAAKEEAEQRFWLPLERSKGRQMGELCVSLLLTKVCQLQLCYRRT